MTVDSAKRYCLIGAGACGLAIVKNFAERGIPFDCFEKESDVGGIWNPDSPSHVYETICLNTSRSLTKYVDFNMPKGSPQFLSKDAAIDYVRAYARHFGLYDHITFNTTVENVEKHDDKWLVTVSGDKRPRVYEGLVVSNGHHWDPRRPQYPGEFTGEMLHAIEVKDREQLRGKKVLIIGAGNTGCDLAADAAYLSRSVDHSMRRTYYFLPKFVFGRPMDKWLDRTQRWPVPRKFLRWMYSMAVYFMVGPYERLGLPKPDHKLLESFPTSASAYLDHLAHKRITPRRDVERFDGKRVIFTDGEEIEPDLVIFATGYHLSFPFMDKSYLSNEDGSTPLFMSMCHREMDNLFASGLLQPADGGFWQLADYQGQLIATFVVAQEADPEKADWFRKYKATVTPDVFHGVDYLDTPRHKLEVQHYRYRTHIKKLLKKFGPVASMPYPTPTHSASAKAVRSEKGKRPLQPAA
ncbi:MAG: NAD(P)-binding domain-containing protein [Hyphomicrobiaceae bacterium]|nr:NAD(P)-binding domain-containing protein [Hyphomicrobiaceae bacterium]